MAEESTTRTQSNAPVSQTDPSSEAVQNNPAPNELAPTELAPNELAPNEPEPLAPPRPTLDKTLPDPSGEEQPLSPAVSVKNFDAWYGDFHVLKNITIDVPEKRVTAFIGPSGCGKSTFLRWINRMNDTIDGARAEGVLHMHDVDVLSGKTDVVLLRRRVGMVFQKPNPFPKSIYDNVAFGPRLHMKVSRGELEELVEWSLRKAALWKEVKDRLRKSALGLSGGQQQRLCIARAIAVGPEVLLMDEPAASLDPRSTASIEDLILELREEYTIAIVTHNMQQAARVSDYTAFLYEGDLIEFGPTRKLYTKPDKEQTENYITGRFG